MRKIAVVGAGSWGTALSIVLAPRAEQIGLWVHDDGLAAEIEATRENGPYLPGFKIPNNVAPADSLAAIVCDADYVLLVVPTHYLRGVFRRVVPLVRGTEVFVSATKGIENTSLMRMSEVLRQEAASRFEARIAVLSGPTFAREIAGGEPAAVTVASADPDLASAVQHAFSGPAFRLYTNDDVAGVEIGASLKNVIAIAAGIVQGLGLGNNTKAALVTRGLAEITRLAVALGGREKTLAGLAGLGDLLLTCTGELSRNRRVGIELASGKRIGETLAGTRMVAEGIETTQAAVDLARKHGVDMPITFEMRKVLWEGKSPRDGIRDLMDRALRSE